MAQAEESDDEVDNFLKVKKRQASDSESEDEAMAE